MKLRTAPHNFHCKSFFLLNLLAKLPVLERKVVLALIAYLALNIQDRILGNPQKVQHTSSLPFQRYFRGLLTSNYHI